MTKTKETHTPGPQDYIAHGAEAIRKTFGDSPETVSLLLAAPELHAVVIASLAVARNLRQVASDMKTNTTLEAETRSALYKMAQDFTRQAEAAIAKAEGR